MENHRKTTGKPWRTTGKPWENQKMEVSMNESYHNSWMVNGWWPRVCRKIHHRHPWEMITLDIHINIMSTMSSNIHIDNIISRSTIYIYIYGWIYYNVIHVIYNYWEIDSFFIYIYILSTLLLINIKRFNMIWSRGENVISPTILHDRTWPSTFRKYFVLTNANEDLSTKKHWCVSMHGL